MKKEKTIVNFILDKSGSMSSVKEATISGFNEYLKTLKNDKKSSYELTLTLFDTDIITQVSKFDIKDVRNLSGESYTPDGSTALYDAVCSTIKNVKEKKGQKVITVIMTDGMENASKEYTEVQMRKLINERTKKGNWAFVYLGANQDSYAVAQKYGVKAANIVNFNATQRGLDASMAGLANATALYSAQAVNNTADFFSDSLRKDIEGTK